MLMEVSLIIIITITITTIIVIIAIVIRIIIKTQVVQDVQGQEIHLYADGSLPWRRALDNPQG